MTSACCNVFSHGSSSKPDDRRFAIVATGGPAVPSSRARRSLFVTRWSAPALILVLLPKCPACLAAYIALGTGVSIGVAASSYLRMFLLGLCVAAILLNVFLFARKRNLASTVN